MAEVVENMQPLNDDSQPVLFYEHPTPAGPVLAQAHLHVEATLNSLSLEMIDLLSAQLSRWAERADVAALLEVLRSAAA